MAREFGIGFFGVSSFALIRSSLSLEIWSTPTAHPRGKLKGAQCSEPVKSKKNNIIKNQDFLVARKKKIWC